MNVTFTSSAENDLRNIHWREAGHVARAVFQFAATGEGNVQPRDETGRRLRLIVGSYAVVMTFDRAEGLTVWRIFRR